MEMSKSNSGDLTAINWVSEDLWSTLLLQGFKMRKCIIKGGLGDWLCVLSVKVDDDYLVGFVGSSTLQGLCRKLLRQVMDEEINWREDKYADQK